MIRVRGFRKYFFLFFLVGQNAYIPFDQPSKRLSTIKKYLTRTICLAISIVYAFQIIKTTMSYSSVLFVFTLLLPTVLTNFFSLYENCSHNNYSQLILIEFDRILDYLQLVLDNQFKLSHFLKVFNKKFVISLGTVAILNIIKCSIRHFIVISLFADFFASIMALYKIIGILHVVLFLDLMGNILRSINIKLVSISAKHCCHAAMRKSEATNALRIVKNIHFYCWEITKKINERFGWFMLITLLESVSTSIYSLIWIFLFSTSSFGKNPLSTLRK